MKRLLLILCLAGAACHAPVSVQTPAGKTAYTADQIVVRVNELENAAIQANSTGGLPVATTRTIVEFCVGADQTLKATPAGWQATVSTAWAAAKVKIGTVSNPAVAAALSSVDVVLATLGGQ